MAKDTQNGLCRPRHESCFRKSEVAKLETDLAHHRRRGASLTAECAKRTVRVDELNAEVLGLRKEMSNRRKHAEDVVELLADANGDVKRLTKLIVDRNGILEKIRNVAYRKVFRVKDKEELRNLVAKALKGEF